MAEITLLAEAGRPVGSRPARRLRHEGRIPAVVYGRGVEPLSVTVSGRDLRTALSTASGLNALLSLEVGETSYLAMAREIQRHPVRGTVTHVDFQVVDRDQTVAADVSIGLVGEAIEVNHADGIVDQQLFTLPVKAKPGQIPPHLEADISGLTVGSAVRVSDLALPDGVTTELDPETVVALGVPPRVQAAEAGEAEGEGAEAGAEGAAEPAAGEARAEEES